METNTTNLVEKTSCTHIFDLFWFCPNPRNQMSVYHREGTFADCSILLADWMTCMNSKLRSKQEDKEKMLSTLSINQPKTSNIFSESSFGTQIRNWSCRSRGCRQTSNFIFQAFRTSP
eukprot:gene11021-23027_t